MVVEPTVARRDAKHRTNLPMATSFACESMANRHHVDEAESFICCLPDHWFVLTICRFGSRHEQTRDTGTFKAKFGDRPHQ